MKLNVKLVDIRPVGSRGCLCVASFKGQKISARGGDECRAIWLVFKKIHALLQPGFSFRRFQHAPPSVRTRDQNGSHQTTCPEIVFVCCAYVAYIDSRRGCDRSADFNWLEVENRSLTRGLFESYRRSFEAAYAHMAELPAENNVTRIDGEEWVIVPSGGVTAEDCRLAINPKSRGRPRRRKRKEHAPCAAKNEEKETVPFTVTSGRRAATS